MSSKTDNVITEIGMTIAIIATISGMTLSIRDAFTPASVAVPIPKDMTTSIEAGKMPSFEEFIQSFQTKTCDMVIEERYGKEDAGAKLTEQARIVFENARVEFEEECHTAFIEDISVFADSEPTLDVP